MFFNKNGEVFSTPGDEENSPPTTNLWVVVHKGRFYTWYKLGVLSKDVKI